MTEMDQFIADELRGILRPGERVLHTAYMAKQPSPWLQALLLGPILVAFMTTPYFVAVTDQRVVLIQTRLGFVKPRLENRGVETWERSSIRLVSTGGFLQNRSVTFVFHDGRARTLRIAPALRWVTGQREFYERVPALLSQKQLAG